MSRSSSARSSFSTRTGMLTLVGCDAAHGRGIHTPQIPRQLALDVDASRWRIQLGADYHL